MFRLRRALSCVGARTILAELRSADVHPCAHHPNHPRRYDLKATILFTSSASFITSTAHRRQHYSQPHSPRHAPHMPHHRVMSIRRQGTPCTSPCGTSLSGPCKTTTRSRLWSGTCCRETSTQSQASCVCSKRDTVRSALVAFLIAEAGSLYLLLRGSIMFGMD